MKELYYSFGRYLKEKFHESVWRISIDSGFNCPNLDGTLSSDGCIYCNNKGFGTYVLSGVPVDEQIANSIKYYKDKKGIKKFIAYFQSFSNTYADVNTLKERYDVVKKFPEIVGIFISTRPDCVDEEKIKLISSYRDNYLVWIEYGLQTTDNQILKEINRHHTYEDFLKALEISRSYKIDVGVHMIIGLPCFSHEKIMTDALRLSKLDIQGIKFHVLHILKNTKLHQLYNKKNLNLLSKEEYIQIICDFLERIPDTIVVLRLVSTSAREYLVAPFWMNERNEILEAISDEFYRRKTKQGYFCKTARNNIKI